MAFILTRLDALTWKICDPERRIELVSLGGGSDDSRYFRLTSEFDDARIAGRRDIKKVDSVPSVQNLITWSLIAEARKFKFGQAAQDEAPLRDLIAEAFDLYGFAGHIRPGDQVKVSFK